MSTQPNDVPELIPGPNPNAAAVDMTTAKPKRKIPIGFLVIGAAVIAMAALLTFNGRAKPARSQISQAPDLPRGDPSQTPEMIADAQKQKDAQLVDRALNSPKFLANGGSVQPNLTREINDPLTGYSSTVAGAQPAPVPASQSAFTVGQNQTLPIAAPPPSQSSAFAPEYPRQSSLLTAMQNEMSKPERLAVSSPTTVSGAIAERCANCEAEAKARDAATPTGSEADSGAAVLMRTGRLLYAAMDLEANSDSANFVQATVQSGPFRGARLQGSFKKTKNDDLEIAFNTISWNKGTYRIDALAVNPEEPKIGLVSSVDHHYISRFGGLFLTGSLAAVGQQLAQQGTTTTTSATSGFNQTTVPKKTPLQYGLIGLGGVAQGLSQLASQNVMRETTVIVSARTPVGVLFKTDWIDKPQANLPDAVVVPETTQGALPFYPVNPTQALPQSSPEGDSAP